MPIQYATKYQLNELCGNRPHQNVVLRTHPISVARIEAPPAPAETTGSPPDVIVYLDDVIDPHNVGAILRTAHFFNVSHVVLSPKCSALTAAVSKASAGALESLHGRIAISGKVRPFFEEARSRGWAIYAAHVAPEEGDGAPSMEDAKCFSPLSLPLGRPLVVVFGNEGEGVSRAILSQCDGIVSIARLEGVADPTLSGGGRGGRLEESLKAPQAAFQLDSLNVSVAAGIIISSIASRLLAL